MAAAGELVDVVDDEDRVVARVPRAEMRARNLLHRAVWVLVVRPGGRALFVHQRTATKDVYPSHWDVTIGGVVASGEGYAAAARRELGEELGITAAAPRPLGPHRWQDAATRALGHVFLAVHDGPVTLQREEIAGGRFVTLAEAEHLLDAVPCCPDGAAAFRRYRSALRAPDPDFNTRWSRRGT
jgi:isopentenyldiphosphate isomerase